MHTRTYNAKYRICYGLTVFTNIQGEVRLIAITLSQDMIKTKTTFLCSRIVSFQAEEDKEAKKVKFDEEESPQQPESARETVKDKEDEDEGKLGGQFCSQAYFY